MPRLKMTGRSGLRRLAQRREGAAATMVTGSPIVTPSFCQPPPMATPPLCPTGPSRPAAASGASAFIDPVSRARRRRWIWTAEASAVLDIGDGVYHLDFGRHRVVVGEPPLIGKGEMPLRPRILLSSSSQPFITE
jgi:hypothetical protein